MSDSEQLNCIKTNVTKATELPTFSHSLYYVETIDYVHAREIHCEMVNVGQYFEK